MSWQEYVDFSLVGSGHLDKGTITSAAGDSVWATTPGFTVQPDEMKNVVATLAGGDAADKLWTEGIHIAGERFVVTKAEGRSIYGRKGREGIVIVKTTQAILIGHYGDGVQAGNAASAVEILADHLVKSGY